MKITHYKCKVDAVLPHPSLHDWNEVRVLRRLLIDNEKARSMHLNNWWHFYNNDPLDKCIVLHKPNNERFDFHLNPGGSRFIGMALRDEPSSLDAILVSPGPIPTNSQFKGMRIDYASATTLKGKWSEDILYKPMNNNDWLERLYNRDKKTNMGDLYKYSTTTGNGLFDKQYELVLYDGRSVILNRAHGKRIVRTYYANSYPSFTDCIKSMFRQIQKELRPRYRG